MKQLVTTGIVLSRTDYGEADRIITLLTPDHGKLSLVARGVRKAKSKLAGGIELFSISNITFIHGKRELGTLISTRLLTHYGNIVKDIDRVQLGYEIIKQLNKVTEDQPEAEYFHLLEEAFKALDDSSIELELIRAWFQAQLLRLAGHRPNLKTDTTGNTLVAGNKYNFDFEHMAFVLSNGGKFTDSHIKVLRLLFGEHTPAKLAQVQGTQTVLTPLTNLIRTLSQT